MYFVVNDHYANMFLKSFFKHLKQSLGRDSAQHLLSTDKLAIYIKSHINSELSLSSSQNRLVKSTLCSDLPLSITSLLAHAGHDVTTHLHMCVWFPPLHLFSCPQEILNCVNESQKFKNLLFLLMCSSLKIAHLCSQNNEFIGAHQSV